MKKLLIIVVTMVLTSLFWIVVYSTGPDAKVTKVKPMTVPRTQVTAGPSGLVVPVAGVGTDVLTDTWGDARSAGRSHEAIDIMAPRGTAVVAAAPGTVEKIFESKPGGHTVYVRSDDRAWIYYYAHLDSYAPGLKEGQRVAQGDPIGRVGDSGNAGAGNTHLHFAINRMGPDDAWYQGVAINPYPLLAGRPGRG